MSKQSTIGGQPGGWSVFGPAIKNKADKVKEIMGKLSDSLDKVRRGPVSTATEAGFTPENVEKAKGWRTDVDASEAQLNAQIREHARLDETLRDLRDQLRQYDSTLTAARGLGDGDDETSQELAAETLGWLIQELPRVRIFVEAMGHEMTPALEQAISRLNAGDQNDPLTARMSQVATQGPSRDELIGQIDRLETELRSAQDQAKAKSVVITSMAEKELEMKDNLEFLKRNEVALRKKTEEEVGMALESKREAESSESRQRAELREVKQQIEVIESQLKERDDMLQSRESQIKEFEDERRLEKELKAVNDKHTRELEAQVRQLEITAKTCQSSRDILASQLDTLRKELEAKEANIRHLNAQVTGDREKLVKQEDLVKGQQLLIEERDSALSDAGYYRKLADSRKASSDGWMNGCQERDRAILRLDNKVADLGQQLNAARSEAATSQRARDNALVELRDAKNTIREQGQSIDSLQKSSNAYYNEVKEVAKLNFKLREDINKRDSTLSRQRVELSSKDDKIREQDRSIKRLAELNKDLKNRLDTSEVKVDDLTTSNERLKGQVKSLTKQATQSKNRGDKYKSALIVAKQAAENMATSVMTQCPPGIMDRIDWSCDLVMALHTQNPWKIQETWSKDPVLAVGERTESLTVLLLHVVASVESRSLTDMVSCLAAIQIRLDEESRCIIPVLRQFLDAVSVCIELEGTHAFQIFLLLQIAERIGRAWPVVKDAVNELTHRGGRHELTSSISRSIASWQGRQRLGSLGCETALEHQDWTLVGFFRNPNGILLLGDSELRWADHDFVEINHNGITVDITVGEGEDEIEFEVEGRNWNWWVEHIL
ncbi:uncharacterized protein FFB20_15746 [Fusarium fujikuroi]|uniref:Uncharacterized protein n=1 Tax=Fusarium fujikuroi TaxID=5127 RepID=A0A2H3SFR5_FUSFU|nr:uncharacterized protein Y057_12225 [Fusarium fujikuroi]KLP13551.1 uncharacterized protein LW94_9978 [Fusarium fujikuroi]QGI67727.1 hypothetical protein CEK27_011698 [Fusarium fujikuroi]QGI84959.1 hypothetical protein CEK25_011688 [Fusarium fujikuroi]QGI98612.1 hypothetical protein CEK26_011681 [Fusarium fujikuroi]